MRGKTPRDGALFYVEGNLKGLTIHGNDFASGGGDRCLYVRTSEPLINTDVAVRDVEITQNYFNDFRNPIVIGGGRPDPSQIDPVSEGKKSAERVSAGTEPEMDPNWIDGVMITGNRTSYLPILEKIQQTGCFLNRARRVTISGNQFAPTSGSALVLRQCEDVTINGNIFQGLAEKGSQGIQLLDSKNASLTGNIVRGFRDGINVQGCESAALSGNNLIQCETALQLRNTLGAAISANMISDAETSLSLHDLRDVSVLGNLISRSGPRVVGGENERLDLQHELPAIQGSNAMTR